MLNSFSSNEQVIPFHKVVLQIQRVPDSLSSVINSAGASSGCVDYADTITCLYLIVAFFVDVYYESHVDEEEDLHDPE